MHSLCSEIMHYGGDRKEVAETADYQSAIMHANS